MKIIRRKTKVGRTATMSVRRKVMFVAQAIKAGRPNSSTAQACLEGPDAQAVKFGVWRLAKRHATIALHIDDDWKQQAMAYRDAAAARRRGAGAVPAAS